MQQRDSGGLERSVAVVSGASSGIGFGVAEELAARGAAVVVNYHSHGEEADALAARVRQAGGKALAVGADVSREDEIVRLFGEAVAAFGRVDILVANAGLQRDAAAAEMSLANWRMVIEVNLTGQFLCCREAITAFPGPVTSTTPRRKAA